MRRRGEVTPQTRCWAGRTQSVHAFETVFHAVPEKNGNGRLERVDFTCRKSRGRGASWARECGLGGLEMGGDSDGGRAG